MFGSEYAHDVQGWFIENMSDLSKIYHRKTVSFGHWKTVKKKTVNLQWYVLYEDKEKILLHLCYGILVMPYDRDRHKVTWEDSSIRLWLNDVFLRNAFNGDEIKRILEVDVENLKDLRNPVPVLYKTREGVFLLSENEIKSLHLASEDWKRELMAGNEGMTYGAWWLRLYGRLEYYSMGVVRADGIVYSSGNIRADDVMIVPALYIKKEN